MSARKCQDGAEERALCMDSKGPPRRGVDCAGAISREAAQWSRSRGNSRKGVGSIPALAFFFCVTGGHGDPRWAGMAGPLRMACGLGAKSTGWLGCDTGFDSPVTLFFVS